MIVVIDNYDSFVHNLARYVELAGCRCKIVRNDQVSVEDVRNMAPEAIVISPGPCTPDEAGISRDVVKALGADIPILGVCLGHQAIGEAYGARTVRAEVPMHGKSSLITHNGDGLFYGLTPQIEIGRYHSLVVDLDEKRSALCVSARSDEGEIMAMHHRDHPVYGVQFHPESVLTQDGHRMIENFIALARAHNQDVRACA